MSCFKMVTWVIWGGCGSGDRVGRSLIRHIMKYFVLKLFSTSFPWKCWPVDGIRERNERNNVAR